ncbi:glycosyltransferase [Lewinellaceae bacterium SD302]|nr:glycosyltransferase [Lewinellaceae bacterium SD302]
MRIAVNTRFLLPDRMEGIGYYTQEVCRELVRRRPDDEFLFLFDRKFDQGKYMFGTNIEAMSLAPPARDPILWTAWFEYAVPKALKKWKADLFFSPDGYCSLRAKTPTVMVTHDIAHVHYPKQIPYRARRYYQRNVPRFLHRAESIVTVSEFVKEDIRQHFGIDPNRMFVGCNGIKPGFRPATAEERLTTRSEFSDGEAYFFYLGAVHPRKNIERLIQAYDRYRAKGGRPYKLLLGGRLAWQTDATRNIHAGSAFREDIRFLGYVDSKDLPRLLGSAHALVYPSLSEGFGVPLLEAMYCEVPVITSNTTSLPEVAGDAGLLIDPESTDAIANALRLISEDGTLVARLVAAGREQKEKFTWARATDAVEAGIRYII